MIRQMSRTEQDRQSAPVPASAVTASRVARIGTVRWRHGSNGSGILRGQRIGHVEAGQAARLQRAGVEVEHHLRRPATEGVRDRRALRRHQAGAQEVHARSVNACSVSPLPDSASWMMGTVEAL